ncbi:putative phosphatase, PHP family [Methanocella paludicola SANAE]|uniref:Phosphatase, PHP family n=1 Tax=Methanocella paludicola (strain DSM 17711 / JCM 13418 / NBRC 101707 / SANAE) TaxID=304371 RepID=D1YVA9_METPS|nr:PHP domain-containing protein [Methanocella paludicola]BAI60381.1 putative phosphatase, PHP family [Methanocella paludicola SANAE]
MFIDTHVHTSHSDGLHPEAQVIRDAASAGISLLSITDHDCVDAYPAALKLAKSAGIRLIPGVEMTTKNEQGCNCIHIVGLGVRTDGNVRSALKRVLDARDESDRGFLANLNAYMAEKYPGWEPVEGIKPSVFQNTLAGARRQNIPMTEKQLMDIIMDPSLWVPIEYEVTLGEAVSLIKEWGGVPVLAHPFDFSNDANVVLKRFLAAGGEAVELCKYRYKVRSASLAILPADELLKKEREMNEWTVAAARKHGLGLTMASDHHDGHRAMGMDPAEYGIDVSWLLEMAETL